MCVGNGINHCPGFGLWMSGEMLMLERGCMTVGTFQPMHALMYAQQINLNPVYRVHWLRAKAQKSRWIEELQCHQVEMESAVRFFQHQEQFWQEKQKLIEPQLEPGHAAWAARQSATWHLMAMQADSLFDDLLKSHPPPDFAIVIRPHPIRLPSQQPSFS